MKTEPLTLMCLFPFRYSPRRLDSAFGLSKRLLCVLLAVSAAVACRHPQVVEGRVDDASMNTVTVRTADGEIITFGTSYAERDCPAGMFIGSPVTVVCDGEVENGFGTAKKVSAPADYNLLIGAWVQPNPIDAERVQGFNLYVEGDASSINMSTLLYEEWSIDGRELTLSGRSIGNGQTLDFSETWSIERLDARELVIRQGDRVEKFSKKVLQ